MLVFYFFMCKLHKRNKIQALIKSNVYENVFLIYLYYVLLRVLFPVVPRIHRGMSLHYRLILIGKNR